MGPALLLVAATGLVVLAGLGFVVLTWRRRPERESALFVESREADAMVQVSAEWEGSSPAWIRLNLRDGRCLSAATPDGRLYEVGLAAVALEPAPLEPDAVRWRIERASDGDRFAEEVAVWDGAAHRVGSVVPDPEGRRLGLPVVWRAHLADRHYRLDGREVRRGDAVVARCFPGAFDRLLLVQWSAEIDSDEARLEVALLLLVDRWTHSLLRRRKLARPDE